MVGKFQQGILNHLENQACFNYLHSNVFFLILVHVCFTFRKYITLIQCLCKYSNHVHATKNVACANFDDGS